MANIELISKIKPKNNGEFALVDAHDIEFEDGKRLDEKIEEVGTGGGGIALPESVNIFDEDGKGYVETLDKNDEKKWTSISPNSVLINKNDIEAIDIQGDTIYIRAKKSDGKAVVYVVKYPTENGTLATREWVQANPPAVTFPTGFEASESRLELINYEDDHDVDTLSITPRGINCEALDFYHFSIGGTAGAPCITLSNDRHTAQLETNDLSIYRDKIVRTTGYYNADTSVIDEITNTYTFPNASGRLATEEWVQENGGSGTNMTVDTELSITSENPVQNKVITEKLKELENSVEERVSVANANKFTAPRAVRFVGMSIWWYDGKTLDSGVGGGVTARGYQTLLKERFYFGITTNYCYSGKSLGAQSGTDTYSIIVNELPSFTGTTGDIWTLDTITNDFKRNIPIGTIEDYNNATGALTYYGALRAFRDKVNELSGDSAIVICANALKRNSAGYTSTSKNTVGHTLIDYEYALVRVAVLNDWHFVDQYRYSGITDETIALTTIDGLHLNNFGYRLAVRPWIECFENIISKNEYYPPNFSGYINENGVVGNNINWARSDYISVSSGDTFLYKGTNVVPGVNIVIHCVASYDANKNFVTALVEQGDYTEEGVVFTVPDGVSYMMFCGYKVNKPLVLIKL